LVLLSWDGHGGDTRGGAVPAVRNDDLVRKRALAGDAVAAARFSLASVVIVSRELYVSL
jgi:hypothetical protein